MLLVPLGVSCLLVSSSQGSGAGSRALSAAGCWGLKGGSVRGAAPQGLGSLGRGVTWIWRPGRSLIFDQISHDV